MYCVYASTPDPPIPALLADITSGSLLQQEGWLAIESPNSLQALWVTEDLPSSCLHPDVSPAHDIGQEKE